MNNEEFKNKTADLIQEVMAPDDYNDKMKRLGVVVFCVFAAMLAMATDSAEKAHEQRQKPKDN